MAYSKGLLIILIIILSNKYQTELNKTSGNLKSVTFASLVSIKSIKSIVWCAFLLLNNFKKETIGFKV